MKKSLVSLVCCSLMLGLALSSLSGCPCPPGQSVYFADAALESAVRNAISKPFGCLTQEDLLEVREVTASGLSIRDLRGLEYCTSMTTLLLRSNKIQSITPLANLTNLTVLDLGDNIISEISALSGLFYLESLELWGANNDVRDFGPLVANAQAGGLGAGDYVVLSPDWTLYDDGTVRETFQADYAALIAAGVTVTFAEPSDDEILF